MEEVEFVLIPLFDTISVRQTDTSALLSWSESCDQSKGRLMEMPFVLWYAKYTALQNCCSYSYLSDSNEMDQVQKLFKQMLTQQQKQTNGYRSWFAGRDVAIIVKISIQR